MWYHFLRFSKVILTCAEDIDSRFPFNEGFRTPLFRRPHLLLWVFLWNWEARSKCTPRVSISPLWPSFWRTTGTVANMIYLLLLLLLARRSRLNFLSVVNILSKYRFFLHKFATHDRLWPISIPLFNPALIQHCGASVLSEQTMAALY